MFVEYHTGNLQKIELSIEPIGEGAEGKVYDIIQPSHYQGFVVKIYKDIERTNRRKAKIEYLIKHKPTLKNPLSVIFPEEIVYQNGEFAGFLMPKARGEADLTSLCNPLNSSWLSAVWHQKYDRKTAEGMRNRLKLCYNIAAAFSQIHQYQNFVFVDIKPENIKVSLDGQISVVDIDSIAIQSGYDVLFPAEKFTQEYSPVEWQETDLQQDILTETWDRFSLGIIFYKILLGLHPYTGTCKEAYSHLTSNEQKIIAGLFPLGAKKVFFETIPALHSNFKKLPSAVRKRFMQCFEEGHNIPHKRPSANDWAKTFKNAIPQYYWLSAFKMPDSQVITKKVEPPQPINKNFNYPAQKIKPTAGLLPSLIISGGLAIGTVGLMQFDRQMKMAALKAKYNDLDKLAKKTPFTQKLDFVDNYDYVNGFKDGVSWVLKDDKYGLIDQSGKQLTPLKYDATGMFKEGKATIKMDGKYGYIDLKGKEVTDLIYDFADDYEQGIALVNFFGEYWFIDEMGQDMFKLDYEMIGGFKEGLANFRKEGVWGFLDRRGNEVIPAEYGLAYPFHEGLALVQRNGYFGYINRNGQIVIPFQYTEATSFSRNRARVSKNNEHFWIDKTGKISD
jgi:serine/threonine protein kinase